jgi:hypothetical protein
MDFKGLPQGGSLLVMIDYYSKFPEIAIMRSTTAGAVIKVLRSWFSRAGYPLEIVTDNGPPFRSLEFRRFLVSNNVKQRTTTPYWPQANGEVERLNRCIGKIIRAAKLDRKDVQEALDEWLYSYRNTPHRVTGRCPVDLVYREPAPDKLPSANRFFPAEPTRPRSFHEQALKRDTKVAAKPHRFQVGDRVYVRQHQRAPFKWAKDPSHIVSLKGDSAVVRSSVDASEKHRHVTDLKKAEA